MKRNRRDRWAHGVSARQQNVDPMLTANNEGLFYGLLLKGGKRLTSTQRVGALMLGFFPLAAGLLVVYGVVGQPDDYGSRAVSVLVNAVSLVIGIAFVFIGLRMWRSALRRR